MVKTYSRRGKLSKIFKYLNGVDVMDGRSIQNTAKMNMLRILFLFIDFLGFYAKVSDSQFVFLAELVSMVIRSICEAMNTSYIYKNGS